MTTDSSAHEAAEAAISPASAMVLDDRYARRAVVASAIGYGLDGFDLLVLSFALTGEVGAGLSLGVAGGAAVASPPLEALDAGLAHQSGDPLEVHRQPETDRQLGVHAP